MAEPVNSARSVAIAVISACIHSAADTRGPNRRRHDSGRLLPVTMPSLADRYCTGTAAHPAASTTHSNW